MIRIMLVEDDADVRTLMQHVLIDGGYEIEACATVAEAFRRLDSAAFDLVIADVKLPDGTGLDVADKARAMDARTLIITAYAFTLPMPARDQHEILLKPLRPAELVAAVERTLASPLA